MDDTYVVGDLTLDNGARRVSGWCWCPSLPKSRQIVEILAGDEVIISIVAAAYDPMLQQNGVGDGKHAFGYTLPDDLSHNRVSARARTSGVIFGRVTIPWVILDDTRSLQLDRAETSIVGLAGMFARQSCDPPARDLARHVGDLGALLLAHAGQPDPLQLGSFERIAAASLCRIVHGRGTMRFLQHESPHLSVILPASPDSRITHAAIMQLAPAFLAMSAELILVDSGQTATSCLFASAFPGMRYVFDPEGVNEVAAANIGASIARGASLLFLKSIAHNRQTDALMQLVRFMSEQPDAIVSDSVSFDVALETSEGFRSRARRVRPMRGSLGLLTCIGKEHYVALGGFDPELTSIPQAAAADLLLRADLLQIGPLVSYRDLDHQDGKPFGLHIDARTRTEASFALRMRWAAGVA